MIQLKLSDNTKITSKILSLLNNISYSLLLCLICFLFFCEFESSGVNAQQVDSDGTIAIPIMQWIDMSTTMKGTSPPGLKDFAFGYSKDSNLAIIFGGTTPTGSKSGATYLLDLTDNTWKTLSDYGFLNPIVPEARSNMIFGVDKSSSYRNAFIIACGQGPGEVLYNDIWAFDFSYKQWTKVETVSGEIPPMYGSIGGIDTTLATPSQTEETNTLWASHGTNGTHFFTDLYALVTTGNLSPNLKTLSATWYKVPVASGSETPTGRSLVAGTILPNKRLALYGGCDKLEGKCATSDTYTLNLGSNYTNGKVNSATPLWSKKNSCLGARSGAAMVMNSNPAITYPNQAIVYGGSSSDGKAVGEPGEVGVFDADLGNWVRVLPLKDPVSGRYPPQRMGAQMAPIPSAIGVPGLAATDILLFGGESTDGNNLNDIWILRLNTNSTSGDTAGAAKLPIGFLKCVPEPPKNGTGGAVIKPGNTGTNPGTDGSDSSDSNDFGKSTTSKSHVTFSTVSFACLPLAASVIRFGYGSNQKWAIAGLYTILIVASYATAFYGFAIAFQGKQKLSGHFDTSHGLFGLILLVLLYIIVPLTAIVSLFVSKRYETDSIDDSDNDKGGIGSKLTDFFNWRNSESNSKTAKSFEVSRPGNRLVPGGEIPSQLPPLKPSDNWMETRKSVTMSSQGSRNNSLQFVPNSRRTSQSTAVSRSGLHASTTSSDTSAAIIMRRIHHIIAQIVIILTVIYIGIALIEKRVVDSLYFYIFIGFMVIIYLIWVIAARYGYPKGRNSLLVLFMHKVACGKGEINEKKQYEYEENYRSGRNGPAPSSNRMRIEDDEMDEEAEQAQLEQDMHNREVVVMTIPKRRLTVVNA